MTGTLHVADDQGDTTHTWDTADPRTVQEIEEIFREAQATGRLVYRQTGDGTGNRSALPAGTPRSTPSCSSPPGWPAASASAVSVVTWWAAGLAAAAVLVPCLGGPIRRGWAALVRRRQARLRAEALLWAWLSPAQRRQYRARRWFEVTTASGRRYRVLRGGVVRLRPRGSGYCIEASSPVPVADEMLANKLLLETDERRFLATAHRFPYR
jgi:hypothetical protein